ncbi:MAG: S8 family serine peptidase, partial [Woeseia sp.]|nr:S8 family serine peptidase [Woeseia sp.]
DRPRACTSTWGEGTILGQWLCRRFDKKEDIQVFSAPENWNGICQTGPQFTEADCNNKMIGARFFVSGAQASGPIDNGEILSPRDVDGHGTHTATTAAGNKVRASIYGTLLGKVEGIAPQAHVATYKACWLRPGTTRANCNTSDLANAIDMAVADGVDIINYSVGNTMLTVTAPDDLALLAAAKAGVLTLVAGGNDGPNFQTLGSPSGNPAVITVAASSRDGQHSVEAIQIDSPASVAGNYASKEASFTPALIDRGPVNGQLVLVDDDDDTLDANNTGGTIDGCQLLINNDEISGNIALIERGGCEFSEKIANAEDAGAIAVIVFNVSGDPIVMNANSGFRAVNIPAVMIGGADGNLLITELDANEIINVVLDKGIFLSVADNGNVMASFSSRGPGPNQDILKPDVTAPGVNILAGYSPDSISAASGESFAYLSGTSMSAPHVAGVAALLKQGHPDWSPAAIKSALMTTARQDVTLPNDSPAIPFDYGSGHIVPNDANDPGLVYDITDDEYDAYSCGVAAPNISQTRCDELALGGFSFASADLNQPSISVSRLSRARTISRRVTNVSDTSATYAAEIEMPPGVTVQVSPASLTIPAGQTANFDVTLSLMSGPLDAFRFGSLTWVSNDHRVRSVISTRPVSIDAPSEVLSSGGDGSLSFPIDFGYGGSYSTGVHGLNPALISDGFVAPDPDKIFSVFDTVGVEAWSINTDADDAFLRFALFDALTEGNDDLDLYVYFCPVDTNLDCYQAGVSGEATSQEQVDIFNPGTGTYTAYIHGFETDAANASGGTNYQLLTWTFGFVDDPGNMSATGPVFVNPGTSGDITVDWNGLAPNNLYLGGISHNTPDGLVGFTLINIAN